MKKAAVLALLASNLVLFACSHDDVPGRGCAGNSDCPAGFVCSSDGCLQLCTSQLNCPEDKICSTDGVCVEPSDGESPDIVTVIGNDQTNSSRVANGIIVSGTALGDARFELQTASATQPLAIVSQSPTRAELTLPADIRSGPYTLVAANSAGRDQAEVTLTLPELDGDEILLRLNTEAAGELVAERLPLTTIAGTGLEVQGSALNVTQGAGSGLDADSLDGNHASDFVLEGDPRLVGGSLITPLRISVSPADVTDPPRRILVNGVDVMGGAKDDNGLYLLVLSGTTHQKVTTDTRFDANYDVNGSDGTARATGLHLALADAAEGDFIVLASQGPVHANFAEFQADLIGMGAVPMSDAVLGPDDLYIVVGKKGLGITEAVEVLHHQGAGGKAIDVLLVDDRIVAPREYHRVNRLVDWLGQNSDLERTDATAWTPNSLDGNLGPYEFYSTGRPLHIYFKAMTYTYAHENGNRNLPDEDAGVNVSVVVDGATRTSCDQVYVRSWSGSRDNGFAPLVCDLTLRVAPGEHTIGFVHTTLGWQTVLYGGVDRSRLVIEELER